MPRAGSGYLQPAQLDSQRAIEIAKGVNPLDRITWGTNSIAASVARAVWIPPRSVIHSLLPAEVDEQFTDGLLGLRVLAGEEDGRAPG